MNKVIQILMDRDGMTRDEALALVSECREEILNCPEDAEDLMLDMLGLEMDYIMDIL